MNDRTYRRFASQAFPEYPIDNRSIGKGSICNRIKRDPQSGRFILWLILVLFIVAVAAVAILLPGGVPRAISFFEQIPPTIQIVSIPSAVGTEGSSLSLSIQDAGAGLDEVKVTAEQEGRVATIYENSFGGATSPQTILVSFNAKEIGLREGSVAFRISAFDQGFFSSHAEGSQQARVLYSRPRVETITTQHNVGQGGAGIAFYRVIAGEVVQSGVKVGSLEFPGFKAALLSEEFSPQPQLYFAFFAVPKNFDDRAERLSIFARDMAGNSATAPMNYRILNRRPRNAPMKLTEEYLRRKIPELYSVYQADMKKPGQALTHDAPIGELSMAFKEINESYRAYLSTVLATITQKPSNSRGWAGIFVRPIAGAPTSAFGELRAYSFDGTPVSRSVHDGIDLAATANAPVRAANAGTVVFANDLGIYGRTVIIDHGFGITSLYGHLSSISVALGDQVEKEGVVGRSGMTGLAGGDHLHFEIRIMNESVTPIEWWDAHWVNDHITQVIEAAKAPTAL